MASSQLHLCRGTLLRRLPTPHTLTRPHRRPCQGATGVSRSQGNAPPAQDHRWAVVEAYCRALEEGCHLMRKVPRYIDLASSRHTGLLRRTGSLPATHRGGSTRPPPMALRPRASDPVDRKRPDRSNSDWVTAEILE